MANITIQGLHPQYGGPAPYGNAFINNFNLTTNATGVPLDADSGAAIASGDVVRLGILPEGFQYGLGILDVGTAATASTTGQLGFAYTDGVDDAKVPQSPTAFSGSAAVPLGAAARTQLAGAGATKTLPKEAWLTLTWGGATNAKAADITAVIVGQLKGPR